MKNAYNLIIVVLITMMYPGSIRATEPWPAENWRSAMTLTHLDPSFRNNMSGACYNPETDTYWVCCNGDPSAFWALKRDQTEETLAIATHGKTKARYDLGKGDLEGICQVDYGGVSVFLLVEGIDKIREYDVSKPGRATQKNEWDISAHVPTTVGLGSEGITFVPDEWLNKGRFTDAAGKPYTSQNGMGGLMFVAHQNGGKLYVFDLGRKPNAVTFVGSFVTSRRESSGLEFDRTTGLLYIWHNTGPNFLEISKLSSNRVGKDWRLTSVVEFEGPKKGNLEGIALTPAGTEKTECLIVDDDNQDNAALMWFREFDPSESIKKANAQLREFTQQGTAGQFSPAIVKVKSETK